MAVAAQLLARVTTERRTVPPRLRRGTRRMWSLDQLPMARTFMTGPRWRSSFGVLEVPIVELDPDAARFHRPGRKLLMFSLEEDVRELLLEEIRPGVFAAWSDPRERLGL
jgi:hypothetical protein